MFTGKVQMTRLTLILLLSTQAYAQSQEIPCEHTAAAVLTYERQILKAVEKSEKSERWIKEVARPLACILEAQEKGNGFDQVLAASTLRPLLGGEQHKGIIKDARYRRTADLVAKLTMLSKDPLYNSVVAHYARGDWEFYKLFCEQGNTDFCVDFLPDEKKVKQDSPLLAAAGMIRLKKAYSVLNGKQREQIAQRLKNLYRDIPRNAALQRRFIDEIYLELFGRELTLG
jgi:hypothetical protein